jgi:hypothetical protein
MRAAPVVLALSLLLPAPAAEASIFGGIGKIIMGVVGIPVSIVTGTLGGPPIVGTVLGVLNGTLTGVSLVAQGLFEVTGSAIPLVLKLAPLAPIFL